MTDIQTDKKQGTRRAADVILYMVVALVCVDLFTTLVGVGAMGATEYNPLSGIMGFGGFMLAKVILSVIGIGVISKYCIPACPTMATVSMGALIGLYSAICVSNVYQIVGHVI